MSVDDCAAIVRDHDPDRYLACMAAPVEMRGKLLAIFAFNAEVGRAAWASPEQMVCQIRLQWWSDNLRQIHETEKFGDHPVFGPLADSIDADGAKILQDVIKARQWDVAALPFSEPEQFKQHMAMIGGSLTWAAARGIGATTHETEIRELGNAAALANWFQVVPMLVAHNRAPLVDPSDAAIRALAQDALLVIKRARKLVPQIARPATRTGWRASKTLRLVAANPAAVASGRLHSSEFSRRASLLVRLLFRSA